MGQEIPDLLLKEGEPSIPETEWQKNTLAQQIFRDSLVHEDSVVVEEEQGVRRYALSQLEHL